MEETTMSEPRPVTRDEVQRFHATSYYDAQFAISPLHKFEWWGVPIIKWPTDIWLYQEYLHEIKPELIIETGTDFGGSALFFGDMMQLLWPDRPECRTISIDISLAKVYSRVLKHPRVELVAGSSLEPALLSRLRELSAKLRTFVTLDSDHHEPHVTAELNAYHEFVSWGSMMVVEDTNLNGHPVQPEHGAGPFEAVVKFLRSHPEFREDERWKKMLFTWFPCGWLRKG
jgi:cephalosporin hydroxylase